MEKALDRLISLQHGVGLAQGERPPEYFLLTDANDIILNRLPFDDDLIDETRELYVC